MGIFPDRKSADYVYVRLLQKGYDKSDISLVARKENVQESEGKKGGLSTSDVATGVVVGGVAGGIAGILLGLGSFVVPGLGALIFVGPIASVLGLTGIAAVAVSGATTGILAGGLTGALVELGISVADANYFEKKIKEGGVLMVVPVEESMNAADIQKLFEENGAENVRRVKDRELNS